MMSEYCKNCKELQDKIEAEQKLNKIQGERIQELLKQLDRLKMELANFYSENEVEEIVKELNDEVMQ